MENRIREVLTFWFGCGNETLTKESDRFKLWFGKNEANDRAIKDQFEGDLIRAAKNKYTSWEETREGRLALIILLDQFSRNIYRGSAEMFSQDEQALKLALRCLEFKDDEKDSVPEACFFYLPLEHTEDIKMQERCVNCFEKLVARARREKDSNFWFAETGLDYAKRHRDIIKRFHRFPHRNALLWRLSTNEEEAFLKTRGSSF